MLSAFCACIRRCAFRLSGANCAALSVAIVLSLIPVPSRGQGLFPAISCPLWSILGTCSPTLNWWHGLTCGDVLAIHSPRLAADLGVSRQAVQQWLSGATQPSRMALMLAEQLCRAPLELAPGLPAGCRARSTDLVVPWKGARERCDTFCVILRRGKESEASGFLRRFAVGRGRIFPFPGTHKRRCKFSCVKARGCKLALPKRLRSSEKGA